MNNTLKTILLVLTIGISQLSLAQDKNVKSFIKSYKSSPDATYINAKSGKDFNFNASELSGVMSLLGNIGTVKMITLTSSTKVKSDFKRLKSKLNNRYETTVNLSGNEGGLTVFTDEDNGYLYAMIQAEENIVVVSLESKD